MSPKFLLKLSFVGLILTACDAKSPASQEKSKAANDSESLAARGKKIYASNCTACHHMDPKLMGNIGPEVWGAKFDLLEARILRADYPRGYTPKRKSRAMPRLPQLKDEIVALEAYLNQSE